MNFHDPSRMRREKQYALDIQTILRHYFDRIYGKSKTASVRVSLLSDSQWLEAFAKQAAQRMVTGTLAATARGWRAAAREGMLTPRLYTALQSELQTNVGTRYYQLIEENAKLISSLPAEVAKLAVMRAARREQEGERADGSFLLGYVTRAHAQLIARTETSKATTALTQARSEDLDLPWYVWQTSRDQRVRESHQFMQGVLVRWDDAPSPERLVGERSYGAYAAGNIFNCFPGNTLVNPSSCEVLFRAYYSGAVVDIESNACATAFTATFNHPILTSRGWIAAGDLNKGDKLAQKSLGKSGILNNNYQEKLVSFDELFQSLSLSGSSQSEIEPLGFDFYNEIPIYEVCAVRPKHNLSSRLKSLDQFFPSADCGIGIPISSILSQVLESSFSSRRDESGSFFASESEHSEMIRFANATNRYSGDSQVLVNRFRGSTVLPAEQDGTKSAQIFSDEVINIRRRQFSGHIYTLQSKSGSYSITERGIIVKNCRCYPEPLIRLTQVQWPHKTFYGGKVQIMTLAAFKRINNIQAAAAA